MAKNLALQLSVAAGLVGTGLAFQAPSSCLACRRPLATTQMSLSRFGSPFWALSPVAPRYTVERVFGPKGFSVMPPAVRETEEAFTLTWDIPEPVAREDVQVSLTDRLITVKAKTAYQSDRQARGGWVQRTSGTQAAARSTVIPEGASGAGAKESWTPEGKLVVTLPKLAQAPTEAKGGGTAAPGVSASYLSDLDGAQKVGEAEESPAVEEPKLKSEAQPEVSKPERGRESGMDVLEEMNKEFDEMQRRFWGVEGQGGPFSFPHAGLFRPPRGFTTLGEMEERAAARAAARRRQRMHVGVQKTEEAYTVTVELPVGTKKEDVTLALEGDALEVSIKDTGARRALRLPRDADASAISARFQAEEALAPGVKKAGSGTEGKEESEAAVEEEEEEEEERGVRAVEMVVPRVAATATTIEIQ